MKNNLSGTEFNSSLERALCSTQKNLALVLAVAAVLAAPTTGRAQAEAYSQNFEVDHRTDGTFQTNFVNGAVTTDNATSLADLYFDYSTIGVPLSPHSTTSSTHALKMVANFRSGFGATPTGVSVLPLGLAVTPNFEMHFDLWENFNGPAPAGGSGSTQIGGAGYGTAGTSAQVGGVAVVDSVFFGATGDGGSSFDYRAYAPAHAAGYVDGDYQITGDASSGYVYASTNGTRNAAIEPWLTQFPGQSPPAAQTALFSQQTGTAQNAAQAFKWRDVSLTRIAGIITYKIDGYLIATVNAADAGTLGGSNVFFHHWDINSTVSSDPNFQALNFTLIDNVRITNFPNLVSIATTSSSITEGSGVAGVFTLTRSSVGTPLTISYAISGNASNGVDYVDGSSNALTGTLTFAASDTTTNISVYAIHDNISEPIESISLSIINGTNYVGAGVSTIRIIDIDPPQLVIASASSQFFERTNDFATFQITRLGNTNAASFPVNVAFSGSAVYGVNYYTNGTVTFEPGVATTNIVIYPIEDGAYTGNLTVNCSLASGGGYSVGTPGSASIALMDSDYPAENILFQDNLQADTSANWTIRHVAYDGVIDDTVQFGFDYSSQNIPPAPRSGGVTTGLYVTANKDATGVAAAVNLYPTGQSFSGNYALRFDMLQHFTPGTSSTEYVLAGLNHSGVRTNWWRSGGVPGGWLFDGVFYALETDGGATPGFVNYSSPTIAVTTNSNPTALFAGVSSPSLGNIFRSPPYSLQGSPANAAPAAPIWSSVEISQLGSVQTLRINNSTIFSYSNATPYVAGNVMLGYLDAFDSLGPIGDYAVFNNVRVVRLVGLKITASKTVGANFQVDFSFDLPDGPDGFVLQTASSAAGPYTDTAATIVQTSPGNYRSTVAQTTGSQFFRVRHK